MTGERFERGLQTRREVLGAEHVDRSLERVTEFSRPVQELVTEYCWGEIWTRPGMAFPMAERLVAAGYTVRGYDADPAVRRKFAGAVGSAGEGGRLGRRRLPHASRCSRACAAPSSTST